jgi:glycosyltransferase involved in cell wall biosynthesis
MKILMYGESPAIMTGLSQVTRVICDALIQEGHEIELIAVNHFLEDYDHDRYPFLIHPCPVDDCRNLKVAKERILSGDYDVFFFGCDLGGSDQVFSWRREARKQHDFISVAYCPVDCDQVPADIFLYFDEVEVSVTYTQHGKRVINRYRPDLPISVIPLACHPDIFYPLSPEEKREARKKLFNIEDDSKFIVTNINRNQGRKDLGRTLMIFHEFHKLHPNSVLYMHCQQQDQGGNLPTMARSIGMTLKGEGTEVIFAPDSYQAIWGFSDESMNMIYNASDCLVSTATGEGWGLSTTSAMCAGCPVVVPGNTANLDLIGENEERGYLVKAGGDIDHQIFLYGMTCNPRDIVHSDSMIKKMEQVYFNKKHGSYYTHIQVKAAREWCLERTPEKIAEQWKGLFRYLEAMKLPERIEA